jgi:hypothetical protein
LGVSVGESDAAVVDPAVVVSAEQYEVVKNWIIALLCRKDPAFLRWALQDSNYEPAVLCSPPIH